MTEVGTMQLLERLEQCIDGGRSPNELAAPQMLGYLLRLCMNRALRTGPKGLAPKSVLACAEQAVSCGSAPMETPALLRKLANDGKDLVCKLGAWEDQAVAWWEPLPNPGPMERCWTAHRPNFGNRGQLDATFAEDGDGFQSIPEFISRDHLLVLHQELTQVFACGVLKLGRSGVGAFDRLDDARSDETCYVDGTEAGLSRQAPHLAALLRRLLVDSATEFASDVAAALYAPQRIMLARYSGSSEGFQPHFDNPGGDNDNGRCRTLTVYLSDPNDTPQGGELAMWRSGQLSSELPSSVLPAIPGSAVLFDSRRVMHQVLPLKSGCRWSLVVWLNERPQNRQYPEPALAVQDVLRPVSAPLPKSGTVVFHELAQPSSDRFTVWRPKTAPRLGVVCTVYRGGSALIAWCRHHLDLGVDHLTLIFDKLHEPIERATADQLMGLFSRQELTIWSGSTLEQRWQDLPDDDRLRLPRQVAHSGDGSQAVAARQMLNASCMLASARTDELGGQRLDWLVHLDADERLLPLNNARGGVDLKSCFSAADQAGYRRLRFINHERLSSTDGAVRYKLNPLLAATLLGSVGWREVVRYLKIEQEGRRPWFCGYFNGKSAVRVKSATLAAGVHGWYVNAEQPDTVLAGPVVLHDHCTTARAFADKYLGKAASPSPEETKLFPVSNVEERAMKVIAQARMVGDNVQQIGGKLEALHGVVNGYSADEIALLQEAGLLFKPGRS